MSQTEWDERAPWPRPILMTSPPGRKGGTAAAVQPTFIERVALGNSDLTAASIWGPTPMSLRHQRFIFMLKHVMGLLLVLMGGNTCALMMIAALLLRLRLQERHSS